MATALCDAAPALDTRAGGVLPTILRRELAGASVRR
jgi:hypothetical protein